MLRVVFKPLVKTHLSSALNHFPKFWLISCNSRFVCRQVSQIPLVGGIQAYFLKVFCIWMLKYFMLPAPISGAWNWLRTRWSWWCSQSAWPSQDCWTNYSRTSRQLSFKWKCVHQCLLGEELHCLAQQVFDAFDQRHPHKGLEISIYHNILLHLNIVICLEWSFIPYPLSKYSDNPSQSSQTLKCPDSAGVLRVKLIR